MPPLPSPVLRKDYPPVPGHPIPPGANVPPPYKAQRVNQHHVYNNTYPAYTPHNIRPHNTHHHGGMQHHPLQMPYYQAPSPVPTFQHGPNPNYYNNNPHLRPPMYRHDPHPVQGVKYPPNDNTSKRSPHKKESVVNPEDIVRSRLVDSMKEIGFCQKASEAIAKVSILKVRMMTEMIDETETKLNEDCDSFLFDLKMNLNGAE
ncbi:hypothetical protein PCE1_001712 [Barthelona sp. PCE]